MVSKVRSVVRVLSLVAGYGLIGVFGFWLAPARAQDAEEGASIDVSAAWPVEPSEAVKPEEPLRPFEPAPSDPGAVRYADLVDTAPRKLSAMELAGASLPAARYREATAETKDSVDQVQAWVDAHHGPSVHNAWSAAVSQPAVKAAQAASAEYEAGLAGTSDLGVR